MPSGAKKRKALKKKKQQEASGTTSTNNNKGFNGDKLHGHDELGNEYERGSDSNSSSSPCSPGKEELGTKHTSAALSSVTVDGAAKEVSGVADVTLSEIAPDVKPVVSVSKLEISEKSEHVETSADLNLVQHKSHVSEKYPSPGVEKDSSKVSTLPRSAAETSKIVESARESEVPESAGEKRLLLPGPPAIRTSWLSCCGLFDAMTGSER